MIQHVLGFVRRLGEDNVSAYAAKTAYFILLSFIPFLLLLLTLAGYTPLSEETIIDVLVNVVPKEFHLLIELIVDNVLREISSKSVAVVPVSAIATLWSAGKGLQALTDGLNQIYKVKETRNYFVGRLRAMLYTLLFILAIIGCFLFMIFGNKIQKMLAEHFEMVGRLTGILINMRTSMMLLILAIIFLLLYKFIPNRKASLRSQLPGAMISSLAWSLFSLGFSFYLDYFGFSNMYGSLTTIILVMLWLYFCMYIMLIGAEINAYFEDKLRQLHRSAVDKIKEEYMILVNHEKEEEDQEKPDDLERSGKNS